MSGTIVQHRKQPGKYLRSLVGQRYGALVVIAEAPSKYAKRGDRIRCWMCQCDCGKTLIVRQMNLRSGNTQSCGCQKGSWTHGMSKKRVYRIWQNMLTRCENPLHGSFPRYGGKGIAVCSQWHTFENFFADMGQPPTPKHSIDRIDGTRDYEPGNCRWATRKVQNRNTTQNRWLTLNGETHIVTDWADILGIPATRIRNRLSRGWSTERALRC